VLEPDARPADEHRRRRDLADDRPGLALVGDDRLDLAAGQDRDTSWRMSSRFATPSSVLSVSRNVTTVFSCSAIPKCSAMVRRIDAADRSGKP
jgi:hypothetical protein